LKLSGVRRFFQIDFCCAASIRNRDSEPETPFWHPARMGIKEEIFTTIITDVSPSTIHDSPIHV
jgi:hypothetical protein